MQIGGVLSEAWSLYQRFLGRFFMTALIVFVALDLLSALADRAAGDNAGANVFWFLLGALISVVGYFWVQAALVETVNDVRDGRADRSIGETYGAVRPRLGAATIAGVLAAIGIGIGLILLIVPGLYLLTIWSMLIPVIVIEGRSAGEAFTRSRGGGRGSGRGFPVLRRRLRSHVAVLPRARPGRRGRGLGAPPTPSLPHGRAAHPVSSGPSRQLREQPRPALVAAVEPQLRRRPFQ